MGKFFPSIPDFLVPWIQAQKIFWVATAPLDPEGHVNVSPKGFEGTFHVLDEGRVWYEDLTGSGVETIAHLRENGRITIMFVAFEGPPRITRLFGKGTVYEFGTPEYTALLPAEKRQPGSRAIIMVDVHKVGTSCGYSIPFFTFKSHRMRLHQGMLALERTDFEFDESNSSCQLPPPPYANGNPNTLVPDTGLAPSALVQIAKKGIKNYWVRKNLTSIDGLPGILQAFNGDKKGFGDWDGSGRALGINKVKDDERVAVTANDQKGGRGLGLEWTPRSDVGKVLTGFGLGVGITIAIGLSRGFWHR